MDTVLQLLLVGLYAVARPILFIGYAAAGIVARRYWHALAGGAGWAVATLVGSMALGGGATESPTTALIRVVAGAGAAWVIFLIARALRR